MGPSLRTILPLLIGLGLVGHQLEVQVPTRLDFVEFFAGDRAVTHGMRLLGYIGEPVDVRISSCHDLLTPCGFFVALAFIMQVRRGGVCWLAPPCSTWVWMSRSSTGRVHGPLGDENNPNVFNQNILVCRLIYLLKLCRSRGIFWIIEQPASSIMFDHPMLSRFLQKLGSLVTKVELHMGCFNLELSKPTILLGWAPYLEKLQRRMTPLERFWMNRTKSRDVATHWVDSKSGKKRSRGGTDLKPTQSYPISFGCAHALAYAEFKEESDSEPPPLLDLDSDKEDEVDLLNFEADDSSSDSDGAEALADIFEGNPGLFIGKAQLAKEKKVRLK